MHLAREWKESAREMIYSLGRPSPVPEIMSSIAQHSDAQLSPDDFVVGAQIFNRIDVVVHDTPRRG
jgi:hypothetical protein